MTSLGYVVVEIEQAIGKPQTPRSGFDWDGGELFEDYSDAKTEAAQAQETAGDQYRYVVADVRLVEAAT